MTHSLTGVDIAKKFNKRLWQFLQRSNLSSYFFLLSWLKVVGLATLSNLVIGVNSPPIPTASGGHNTQNEDRLKQRQFQGQKIDWVFDIFKKSLKRFCDEEMALKTNN